MPRNFVKGNTLGAKRIYERRVTQKSNKTITFRPYADQYDRLKAIPNLQQALREAMDKLIVEHEQGE